MSEVLVKDLERIQKIMDNGNYKEARPLIEEYLKESPNDPVAIRLYGNTYAYSGFIGKAKKIWRSGLKKFPENVDLLYNYALANYLQGNLYYAKKYWLRARKYAPEDPEIYFNLGQVARDEGYLKKAIKLWRKAVSIDDNVETMNNIGMAYYTLQMFGKASTWYRKALSKDNNYALAHLNLAISLAELGEFDDAILHAETAAELDPSSHMNKATELIREAKEALAERSNS